MVSLSTHLKEVAAAAPGSPLDVVIHGLCDDHLSILCNMKEKDEITGEVTAENTGTVPLVEYQQAISVKVMGGSVNKKRTRRKHPRYTRKKLQKRTRRKYVRKTKYGRIRKTKRKNIAKSTYKVTRTKRKSKRKPRKNKITKKK